MCSAVGGGAAGSADVEEEDWYRASGNDMVLTWRAGCCVCSAVGGGTAGRADAGGAEGYGVCVVAPLPHQLLCGRRLLQLRCAPASTDESDLIEQSNLDIQITL